jgi:hypothetical protein
MNGGWEQVEEIFHQALQHDPENYESTLRKAAAASGEPTADRLGYGRTAQTESDTLRRTFRRSPWLPKKSPEFSVIGHDLNEDRAKGYTITESGVVVVTPPDVGRTVRAMAA